MSAIKPTRGAVDKFGTPGGISSNIAIVGAHHDRVDGFFLAGSACLFVTDGDGALPMPDDELTDKAVAWIEANFPVPPSECPADLNADGILDNGDIQSFVTLFLAGC